MFSRFTGSHLPHVISIKLWTNDHNDLLSLHVDHDEPLRGQTKVYLGAKESTVELLQHDQRVEEHSFAIASPMARESLLRCELLLKWRISRFRGMPLS